MDFSQHRFRQSIPPSNDLDTHSTLFESSCLQAQKGTQEPEDTLNLGGWTMPVIGRECVERQLRNPDIQRSFHDTSHRGDSGAMACDAGQAAP